MKLSQLPPKTHAIIQQVDIDLDDIRTRLSDFGLRVGLPISCVDQSPLGGPKAYRLSHGVFALDREISDKIQVSQENK